MARPSRWRNWAPTFCSCANRSTAHRPILSYPSPSTARSACGRSICRTGFRREPRKCPSRRGQKIEPALESEAGNGAREAATPAGVGTLRSARFIARKVELWAYGVNCTQNDAGAMQLKFSSLPKWARGQLRGRASGFPIRRQRRGVRPCGDGAGRSCRRAACRRALFRAQARLAHFPQPHCRGQRIRWTGRIGSPRDQRPPCCPLRRSRR